MGYTIRNEKLTVTVQPQGAQLAGISSASGRELLWDGNPEIWPNRAPLCFPWCGAMEEGWYEYGGKRYENLPRHGFVRELDHEIVRQSADKMTFRLDWPGDGDRWPWAFRFETTYHVVGDRLINTCTAVNRSQEPMPVQMGFHPGFRLPLAEGDSAGDYQFRFASGQVVPLDLHMFDVDSIAYDNTGDWVRLEQVNGEAYIQVNTAGFFRVLLWSKPGVPGFVCIEPWQGYPGPEHDLAARPGATQMAPGEERRWTLDVTFHC